VAAATENSRRTNRPARTTPRGVLRWVGRVAVGEVAGASGWIS
jgi:hypothetical protein